MAKDAELGGAPGSPNAHETVMASYRFRRETRYMLGKIKIYHRKAGTALIADMIRDEYRHLRAKGLID